MDDRPSHPLVLANRVIHQLITHSFGMLDVTDDDYGVIRVSFRARGGSWEALQHGDQTAFDHLKSIIKAWGTRRMQGTPP